jgi:magnesium transporter
VNDERSPGQGTSELTNGAEVVSSLADSAPELCQIVHADGMGDVRFTREGLEELVNRERFFWLDLHRPDPAQFKILREVFEFHPLAIEDAEEFHQRPKVDEYEGFAFLVVYGAAPDEDRLVEVHCFYSERFIITIHRDECPAFSTLRDRYAKRPPATDHPSHLLYRIVDSLVDSFFPALAELDDQIDELQDAIFERTDEAQLQEVFRMKRLLVGLRKVVTPQRDTFAGLTSGQLVSLPGISGDDERYFRDVYDHLVRISDLIDSYRDLLTGVMEVYLSTVSNRLNRIVKELTIIATIFLPLTWLTGFFGQNFGWMVSHIGRWESFLLLGPCAEIALVAAMLVYFWRRRWV